jgi:hypothetical protein
MKVNPAPLHLAQTVITGLVVGLSLAILGTSAHTLDVQQATDDEPMVGTAVVAAL